MNKQLLDQMSAYAGAMANSKRLEILTLLANGEMTAGEIAKTANLTMPNLSQHLTVMKQFGIVRSRKEGLNQRYSLTGLIHSDVFRTIRAAVISHLERTQELLKAVR